MAEQTDEDRLSGLLRLRLGGVEVLISALPIRPAHRWLESLKAALDELAASVTDDRQAALVQLAMQTTESAVDLIVAYDLDGGIAGGREWLMDHALPKEIHDALEVLRVEAIPFGEEVTLMGMMVAAALRRAAELDARSSTNGPSPTGDLPAPTPLNRASRRRNSRSSGKQARNGPDEKSASG